jgi:hypothetical protein
MLLPAWLFRLFDDLCLFRGASIRTIEHQTREDPPDIARGTLRLVVVVAKQRTEMPVPGDKKKPDADTLIKILHIHHFHFHHHSSSNISNISNEAGGSEASTSRLRRT